MRRIGSLLLVGLAASSTPAATPIPAVGQPTPFYGAAGSGVKAEAAVIPSSIAVDQDLAYTITIRNLVNAADVQKPDLAAVPAFAHEFQVEDDPAAVNEPPGTRVFRYRLRPRRVGIAEVPVFVFPYYDPKLKAPPDQPSFPFRRARTEAIPIKVGPKPVTPLPVEPLDVPTFAESIVMPPRAAVPAWAWWLGMAVPPLAAIGYCVAWRAINPQGARLAQRRRTRAARLALRSLHQIGRRREIDPAAVVVAVGHYLAERFNLPRPGRTPDETARFLRQAEVSAEVADACEGFFREADTVRFAPRPHVSAESLLADAERLVRRLEEGP